MAKVLERSSDLYQKDLLAWLEQQAAHLRAGQLEEVAQKAFAVAVKRAAIETGLKRSAFPASLPYAVAAILEDEPD